MSVSNIIGLSLFVSLWSGNTIPIVSHEMWPLDSVVQLEILPIQERVFSRRMILMIEYSWWRQIFESNLSNHVEIDPVSMNMERKSLHIMLLDWILDDSQSGHRGNRPVYAAHNMLLVYTMRCIIDKKRMPTFYLRGSNSSFCLLIDDFCHVDIMKTTRVLL